MSDRKQFKRIASKVWAARAKLARAGGLTHFPSWYELSEDDRLNEVALVQMAALEVFKMAVGHERFQQLVRRLNRG